MIYSVARWLDQCGSRSVAMMSRTRLLACCWIALVCIADARPQKSSNDAGEYFGFPQHVEDLNKLPKDNRTALQMPQVCAENEWYFPGDQEGVYVCDCIPGYIYHTQYSKCFRAHFRGPCAFGELLVLAADGFTPVCRYDPCASTGRVTLPSRPRTTSNKTKTKSKCVRIDAACDVDTRRLYGVNETTFVVECLPVSRIYGAPSTKRPPPTTAEPTSSEEVQRLTNVAAVVQRGGGPDLASSDVMCLPGCRRYAEGKCPVQ